MLLSYKKHCQRGSELVIRQPSLKKNKGLSMLLSSALVDQEHFIEVDVEGRS